MLNFSDIYKKRLLKFKGLDLFLFLYICFYMCGKNEIFSLFMIFVELKKRLYLELDILFYL